MVNQDVHEKKSLPQVNGSARKVVYWTGYYFITLILIFSGISKIIDPIPTIDTIKAAFKISDDLILVSAAILPLLELSLALLMLFKYRLKATLLVVTLLFSLFLLFAIYGALIGLNIDCGCFSNVVRSEFGMMMIIRNIGLLSILVCLLFVKGQFID